MWGTIKQNTMKNLNDVRLMAETLMTKQFTFNTYHGVYTLSGEQLGYTFKFDSAKRRFGCCSYGKKTIGLSMPLCNENLDKIDTKITDTMLHELAHAFCVHVYGVRDGRGHGYNWQHIAKQIGCDAKRCFSSDSINLPKSKYTLLCENCGKETPKHKVIRKTYACAKCCDEHNNGKFSYDYQLKLVTNY